MTAYERLKAAAESKDPVRLFKEYVTEVKQVEGAEHQYSFTITTQSADRDRDEIAAAGWKLEGYLKNPVVLWAHDYRQPPVAISRSIGQTEKGLTSVADFTETSKIHEMARTVDALIRIGALRATSVGFRPIKYYYNEERRGVDFAEQELLEYSIVPVPANAECLIEARGAGIDVEPLREWAAKTLEALGAERDAEFARVLPKLAEFGAALDALGTKLATWSVPAAVKAEEPKPKIDGCPEGASCQAGSAGDGSCGMGAKCPMGKGVKDPAPAAPPADKRADEPVPADTTAGAAGDDDVVELTEDPELDIEKIEAGDEVTADQVAAAIRAAVAESVRSALALARGRVD